jgi:hypothetical protein
MTGGPGGRASKQHSCDAAAQERLYIRQQVLLLLLLSLPRCVRLCRCCSLARSVRQPAREQHHWYSVVCAHQLQQQLGADRVRLHRAWSVDRVGRIC